MKLTTKFNTGDNVWFFEQGKFKFFEGTITDIQSWDKWGGFRYELTHINSEGVEEKYYAEEKRLYVSQEEILTTLFEANGTPNPAGEAAPQA